MEFFGTVPTEEIDEEYNNVFKINPLSSLSQADEIWDKGLEYCENSQKMFCERYESVLFTAKLAQRYFELNPLFQTTLITLDTTMTLYSLRSEKDKQINRKRVLYGLWNRPMNRENVSLGERWSVEDVKNMKKSHETDKHSSERMLLQFQNQKTNIESREDMKYKDKILILHDKFIEFWRDEDNRREREIEYFTNLINELENH